MLFFFLCILFGSADEVRMFSETSVHIYQTTQSHVPEDSVLLSYRRQNFKSHIIYSLFICALSNIDFTLSNDWMLVNNELARIWREAVVA
jgi:hypothetical protein